MTCNVHEDECGVCGGDSSSCADCAGVPNGSSVEDECGVCNGDNSSCADCLGVPNGDARMDFCGVCEGDNSSCLDCAGVPNGGAVYDDCGICGGNNGHCQCLEGYISTETGGYVSGNEISAEYLYEEDGYVNGCADCALKCSADRSCLSYMCLWYSPEVSHTGDANGHTYCLLKSTDTPSSVGSDFLFCTKPDLGCHSTQRFKETVGLCLTSFQDGDVVTFEGSTWTCPDLFCDVGYYQEQDFCRTNAYCEWSEASEYPSLDYIIATFFSSRRNLQENEQGSEQEGGATQFSEDLIPNFGAIFLAYIPEGTAALGDLVEGTTNQYYLNIQASGEYSAADITKYLALESQSNCDGGFRTALRDFGVSSMQITYSSDGSDVATSSGSRACMEDRRELIPVRKLPCEADTVELKTESDLIADGILEANYGYGGTGRSDPRESAAVNRGLLICIHLGPDVCYGFLESEDLESVSYILQEVTGLKRPVRESGHARCFLRPSEDDFTKSSPGTCASSCEVTSDDDSITQSISEIIEFLGTMLDS